MGNHNSYAVATLGVITAAAFLLSKRTLLMHEAQSFIRVMTPFIGRETQCKFGANARTVFCARFFHCPPATPVWWVCERPAWVFFEQMSH